jgi:hypothetical protein
LAAVSCDGGGGAVALPACGFRKDAKRDRKTSALLDFRNVLPKLARRSGHLRDLAENT